MIPELREDVARRFPLVPRGRPVCHPLDVRVRQVADLADSGSDYPEEATRIAAEAHNLGALVASDCGFSSLARDLCWRQFQIFHDAQPFDAATAKLALQPLVNLGRLLAREGNGTAAHHLIETLFTAVRHSATGTFGGTVIDLGNVTHSSDDHREIVQWLWTVLLADGIRALAQAGRWSQALQHVQDHRGISRSLLDGRQIAIIAHRAVGDRRTSTCLLTETDTPTPWERTVAAGLAVLTSSESGDPISLVDRYLPLGGPSTQVVFRTRLGLVVLDLVDERFGPRLAHTIAIDVQRSQDAYAAREVLAHAGCASLIPATARRVLTSLVQVSCLGRGTMPIELWDQFRMAMTTAETSLREALSRRP
ncbi:hypothetical protein [Sphaerisporangium corydalis]|uniref:XRE family transcriptional regulator n=1 Tax=Sphaerisporangium corydalis TaxID=1441875 RepID=A0ABV9E938_9ACTN|nr:hypothetical protein [Sphaerisporangium corydalis]